MLGFFLFPTSPTSMLYTETENLFDRSCIAGTQFSGISNTGLDLKN